MLWSTQQLRAILLTIPKNPLGHPTTVASLLREFWTRAHDGHDPLALLREWAEKRPERRIARSAAGIRREHNRKRLTQRWQQKPCWVCARLSTQEHHIIQVQHGGTNAPKNKVWICTDCHRKVHPFMAQPPTKDAPVGIVPYMGGTEQPGTCPACQRDIISVQPVLKRLRYPMAQSTKPILLEPSADAPYHTTDLHQPHCYNKPAFSRLKFAELGHLARRDAQRAIHG